MICAIFFTIFFFPIGFADKHAAIPNFNLVNQPDLDKILKVKVFVHSDGQLRAAHLVLGYNPLSSSFQALKCMIKVKDPRLHLVNVAAPGFLNPSPAPKGVLKVTLPLQYTAEEPTPSQPAIKEEEEEDIIEISDSGDDFEVFNPPESPESQVGDSNHLHLAQVSRNQEDTSVLEVMGIQCKPRASLLEIMESQVEARHLRWPVKLNTPLFLLLMTFSQNLQTRKRKQEQKGKDVMEEG